MLSRSARQRMPLNRAAMALTRPLMRERRFPVHRDSTSLAIMPTGVTIESIYTAIIV